MKTLSIRQPWAWLIVHGGKDIENRSWLTKYRGRFLVHAGSGMTKKEYAFAAEYAKRLGVIVPPANELLRGGVIGSVELIDCLASHESRWYMSCNKALVLCDPRPIPFFSVPGRLGFFDIPCSITEPHNEVVFL
ncbi:ASCH domain-containing protein (plasmid) [Pseudomonas yamanorum]|nr:ASCH domain-containing protein [Pseudomonas yamanorum]